MIGKHIELIIPNMKGKIMPNDISEKHIGEIIEQVHESIENALLEDIPFSYDDIVWIMDDYMNSGEFIPQWDSVKFQKQVLKELKENDRFKSLYEELDDRANKHVNSQKTIEEYLMSEI